LQTPSSTHRRQAIAWASALALVYAAICCWLGNAQPEGDEIRYMDQCYCLTQGYFLPSDRPELLNGPGYPLSLLPLVKIGAPMLALRLTNVLWAAFGFFWYWQLARRFMGQGWALTFGLVCWLHPVLLRQGGYLMAEVMSQALLGAVAYLTVEAVEQRTAKSLFRAALVFAALTMTRVIFGHVMMAMLVFAVLTFMMLKSWRATASRIAFIMGGGLLCCIPYLIYSHNITGKWLKWSTSGGELMYWLTSHHPGENGNWYSEEDGQQRPELSPHHKEFMNQILAAGPVKAEELYAEKIRENLEDPAAVLHNYLCNWSRMFFGFPRSFEPERLTALVPVITNGLVLVLLTAAVVLCWLRGERLPQVFGAFLLMAFVYMGGSSLAPSQPRYLLMALPLLLLPALWVLSRVPWRALVARSPV
jgi:hypothetical protein